MRKRNVQIYIRVSEKEKLTLTRKTKKCGLTLSEYFRQTALGYEPKEKHDEQFHEAMRILCEVYAIANQNGYAEIKTQLTVAIEKLSCG